MEDGRNVGGHVNAAMKQAEIKRREKETGEEVKQLISNVKAVRNSVTFLYCCFLTGYKL